MKAFILVLVTTLGFFSLLSWRFAFLGLVLFTPFNTGIAIAFSNSAFTLMKEFFFAIPLYIKISVFFLKLKPHSQQERNILISAFLVISIVIINFFISNLNSSFVTGLIGMKVWLFYLPLIPITCVYLRSYRDLAILQRCFTVVGMLVCAVGIYQFIGAFFLGQQPPIFAARDGELFGGFREFNPMGGRFRFPGTFSNSNLFGAFCLFQALFILPAALHEPQSGWKKIYSAGFLSACIGVFVSGQLTIWVMFILLLLLFAAWTRRLGSVVLPILGVGGFVYVARKIAAKGLERQVYALQDRLPKQSFFGTDTLWFALQQAPLFGQGLGTATIQARHADGSDLQVSSDTVQATDFRFLFESYPAKVVFELGGIGAIVTYAFYLICWYSGWTIQRKLYQPFFQDLAKALLLLMAVIYLYPIGNWLDPEPLNVYYWVMVGILLALPRLDREVTCENWYINASPTT